jgi:hypothetical protein
MAETQTALGSLGSDLAFSVSFGIGRELMDAAKEGQIAEDELIAVVLIVSIVFTALPRSFRATIKELRAWGWLSESTKVSSTESGLLAFGGLLIDIGRRIAISLAVQLLAANVRAKQVSRSVRIVSLLSVAVFFRASPLFKLPAHNAAALICASPVSTCAALTSTVAAMPLVFLEASSSIGLKVRRD